MSPRYAGPLADIACQGCGQRLIRIFEVQTLHPWCEERATERPTDLPRALLSLSSLGVAGEVLDGDAEARAAMWLGRLWERGSGYAVVEIGGKVSTYRWPAQWALLLADCLAADAETVYVDRALHESATAHEDVPADRVRWLS